MKLSREYDTLGMLLAKQQAMIFSHASEKGLGSYYFLKRYITSSLCDEFDTLAILQSPLCEETFWLENENNILKNGKIYPKDVMHWVGYIYRYWHFYTKEDSSKILRQAPVNTMKRNFMIFHTMDPVLAIEKLKEIHKQG